MFVRCAKGITPSASVELGQGMPNTATLSMEGEEKEAGGPMVVAVYCGRTAYM